MRRIVGASLLLALAASAPVAATWTQVGRPPDAAARRGFRASPQWGDGEFVNVLPQTPVHMPAAFGRVLFGTAEQSEPDAPVSTVTPSPDAFARAPESGLRVTWLGHSTLFVEIDGQRILIDPVWCERASPFPFAGPQRFHAPPVPLDQLLPLDAVIISHDHYDHLDMETVRELVQHDLDWVVPLGVGSHLEYWGADAGRVTELDWWDTYGAGEVVITATPSRHSSGRAVYFTDTNATLWAGWALNGPEHAVFYSGDTSMHDGFAAIGERLGPFDLSILEVGAYDALWMDNHLGPEQAVVAHGLVRGERMLPVHWATFSLAAHGWTEPAERVVAAARRAEVPLALPRPGESFEPTVDHPREPWWPAVAWKSAAENPIWSSSVEHLLVGAKPSASGSSPVQEPSAR